MTWIASNLTHGGRELALVNLLTSNRVDVMVVTETELPVLLAPLFAVPGYTAFLSSQSKYLDKHRVMTLVKSSLAVSANARICEECELSRTDRISDDGPTRPSTQTVWVCLDLKDGIRKRKTVVVGGAYREWGGSTKDQEEVVSVYGAQMLAATLLTQHVVVLGDFNLDWHRSQDSGYGPRPLLLDLGDVTKTAGLRHLATAATFQSHGLFPTATGPPAPRV
jgi:hypothetical protein